MLNEIIWKLFLAFGMDVDALMDTLVGTALVIVFLGLSVIAAYDERTHPGESWERRLRILAIMDRLDRLVKFIQERVELFLMRFTPPEIWQSTYHAPSLGRILVFLIFLPLRINMVIMMVIMRWVIRRSRRG